MADNELSLIKKAQKGSVEAFEKLIIDHEKFVYNLAFSMLHNEHDAYDASQEVFIKVFKSLDTFSFTSKFSTWLHRITVNTVIDIIRKQKRTSAESIDELKDLGDGTAPKQIVDTAPTPEAIVLEKEGNKELIEALNELSEEHKVIIILRDVKGYEYEEIGNMLDISVGTVKSRISRARNNLREIYIKKWNK